MDNTKNIVIGIPTFQRPKGLARLLESIAEQRTQFQLHVLVADNEGEGGAGLGVVEELLAQGFPFPITGIAVPERGISQVRNALMKTAFENLSADGLAMVDDDERVEPGWLAALVAMQTETSADVVGGAVFPEFESPPPSWTRRLRIYWRRIKPPGPVPLIPSTTNVYFSRSVYDKFPKEHFDLAFSLTGGGDKEYFCRIKQRGATFAFQPEARSHELFGFSRVTLKWALQRAYRIGAGDARVLRLHSPGFLGWLKEVMVFLAATSLALMQGVVFFWSPAFRTHAFVRLARQAGKVSGFLGRLPKVYLQVHGS